MEVKVARSYPPNIDAIEARFRVKALPVIFAYGDTIYNPFSIDITPSLMAHESVHGERQRACGVEEWWRDYIERDDFRLDEEILAHRAEYQNLVKAAGDNRRARRLHMAQMIQRLRSPLYQFRITPEDAKRALLGG